MEYLLTLSDFETVPPTSFYSLGPFIDYSVCYME